MDRFELAWAAGFFDGEGWASAVAAEGRRTRQPQARINQADPNGVPAVLARFQRSLGGLGRIGGPYTKDGREDLYWWDVSSRGDVKLLHHFLLPWLGRVKLEEFGETLERPPARSRLASDTDEWLAWCAGLFDGEGWASMWSHRTHAGYLSAEIGVGQSSNDGQPEVLRRFQSVLGGRIYGPYKQSGATMDVYRLKASALSSVEEMATRLRPWVSPVKRADLDLVGEILRGQPPLPRGRPDWGNRKTHCIHGHEYASSRVRPYRSRGKDSPPRDSHQCLICAREQAKARREQKRRSAADDGRQSLSETAAIYLLK